MYIRQGQDVGNHTAGLLTRNWESLTEYLNVTNI